MRSAFFEFNVARSALFVARGGLDIVNHNVANQRADAGYSRQYIEQRATSPMNFYNGRGMIGTGSHIYGIGQHRDFFLDRKYWNERATLGQFQLQSQQLQVVEMRLNEMRGTGTTAGFGLFFTNLSHLSTDTPSGVARTNVIQSANGLQMFINDMALMLRRQQLDANQEVAITVGRINSIGNQIASLNDQIARAELSGSRANDLRDSRTRLVDELSLLVNVEVLELERNLDFAAGMYPEPEQRGRSQLHFRVSINGQEFVDGSFVNILETVARAPGSERNPTDVEGLFDVHFKGSKMRLDIYNPSLRGQLRGLIDVRDGNNGAHVTAIANQLTFGAAAGGLIPLTITDPGRDDLNSTGLIRLVNDQGRFEEISYSGLVYNANGSVTMQLADPLPAGFTAANITRVELGRTNVFKGLPHYMNKFNELVRTFARAINEGTRMNGTRIPNAYLREERDFTHILDDMANGGINGLHEMARAHWAHFAHLGFTDSNGIGTKMIADLVADGIIAAGATPTDLQALNWYRDNGFLDVFTYDHTNPSQALYSFALNPILAARPGWVAVNTNNSTGESFNDVVLKGFAAVNNFNGLFAEGKLSDFVIAMSGELGIDLQMAQRFEGNYNDIVQTVEIQRLSISGVDVNEEMLDMMRFQHIYQAAARLVNIIDGIYDTTINRLGVGF